MAVPDALRPGARSWAIAAAILAVLVGVVSLLPPRGTPGGDIADLGETLATVGHVLAYTLTGACFAMSLAGRLVRRAVLIVVILSGYGALLEILQGALSARSFQWSDVVANVVGALVGVATVLALRRR